MELRKEAKWTQVELAERLHYTDKAVSKWERGESLPELVTLKKIADIFGVTIDYLTSERPREEKKEYMLPKIIQTNRMIITAIVTSFVFIAATIIFVYGYIYLQQVRFWTAFVWAVPVSALTLVFFNRQWGSASYPFIFIQFFFGHSLPQFTLKQHSLGRGCFISLAFPFKLQLSFLPS